MESISQIRHVLGAVAHNGLRSGYRTSREVELGWVAGRAGVVGVALGSAATLLSGTTAASYVYGAAGFAAFYNLIILGFLLRDRLKVASTLAFVLDNATVLFAWWSLAHALAHTGQTSDLYMIAIPLLLFGATRLGWLLGSLYTAAWIGWVVAMNLVYPSAPHLLSERLPIRIAILALTVAMTLRLVLRLSQERIESDRIRQQTSKLAELGQGLAAAQGLDATAQIIAGRVPNLIEFESAAVHKVVLESQTATRLFEFTPDGKLDIGPTGASISDSANAAVLAAQAGSLIAISSRAESATAVSVPMTQRESTALTLTVRPAGDRKFSQRDMESVRQIAERVGPAVENAVLFDELEKRVQERTAELQHANDTMTRLFSILSHEMKNPLSAVLGFSELLLDRRNSLSEHERERLIEIMSRNAKTLERLVVDMGDISALRSGQLNLDPEPFNLEDLLSELRESFSLMLMERDQVLRIRSPQRAVSVFGDRTRLYQAIANLVSNASKYSPNGAQIEIRVENAGGDLRVTVRDNGIGISPEDQARLFQPFFRAESSQVRAQSGTGLGLLITKLIVDLHRGSIGLESTPGRGTQIWFVLPRTVRRSSHPLSSASGS